MDHARAGSGFDTFLIEGYQYPGINHQPRPGDPVRRIPVEGTRLDPAHCRYLMGLYYGTCRGSESS